VSFKNFVPLLIILVGFAIYAYLESPEQVLNRANSGDGRAQLKLARKYSNVRDDEKAYFWYLKAAKSGNSDAQSAMGIYLAKKGQYPQALAWFKKKEFQQASSAATELALWYGDRYNPQHDYHQALYWAKKALDTEGKHTAENIIGCIYYEGLDAPKDYPKALFWLQKASKGGNPLATGNLAEMYYRGRGVPQNYQKALELYKKAVKEGNLLSAVCLGYMYEHGLGTLKDPVQAVRWYTVLSHKYYPDALYEVSDSFTTGQFTDKDPVQALVWMTLAAQQKYPLAIKRLPALSQALSPSQKEEAKQLLARIALAAVISNTMK
jgi:uncharacterized protein